MPLRLQTKLLRVLQDGEIRGSAARRARGRRAASSPPRTATSRRHRAGAVPRGPLLPAERRQDPLPPLRERREEIPLLVDALPAHVYGRHGRTVDVPAERCGPSSSYEWPGNIRELENEIERIVVLGSSRPVHVEIVGNLNSARLGGRPGVVALEPRPNPDAPISLKDIARQAARDAERVAIKEVLDRVHWNRARRPGSSRSATRRCSTRSCNVVSSCTTPTRKRSPRRSWPPDGADESLTCGEHQQQRRVAQDSEQHCRLLR